MVDFIINQTETEHITGIMEILMSRSGTIVAYEFGIIDIY